jgi:DNA-directed RNA polymerase omega subunit
MINEPNVDVMINHLGENGEPASRYVLCVVAAKRARQILDQTGGRETPEHDKELTIACREIAAGKISATKD